MSPAFEDLSVPFSQSLLVCFSHLRWNFVFQRPQHLLIRASKFYRVVYFEEPLFDDTRDPFLREVEINPSLCVLTPVLPHGTSAAQAIDIQKRFAEETVLSVPHGNRVLWYYTPMALDYSRNIVCDLCVFDCMDELSAFKFAPPELIEREKELFQRADVVFTGGQSLYEAKRRQHHAIYPFPSSIDTKHFHQARKPVADPPDQVAIPHPRVGFFGVIDERLDIELIAMASAGMPDVQFVMVGPVVKIDPATLPQGPNIHWLGSKSYDELPFYLAHWNAGWMPFALNESTRYISPTKTPEFLAAGLPVVSTAIVDVVRTYGAEGLVEIADEDDIVQKLRTVLAGRNDILTRRADDYLSSMSWDRTWNAMATQMVLASSPANNIVPLKVGGVRV